MNENILYSDKLIEISNDAITLRKYYFPTFSKKIVKISEIEKIVIKKPTLMTGKFRLWGTGDFFHWFPLDQHRTKREVIFFLSMKNKKIKIGFTVEDSAKVIEILKEKLALNLN